MRRKNTGRILFIAEGGAIVVLLIVLLMLLHRSGSEIPKNTEEGRAYIASENAKDPARMLEVIKEARQAAERSAAESRSSLPEEESEADPGGENVPEDTQETASETGIPDGETIVPKELQEQILTLDIRELTTEEIALLRQRYDSAVIVGDSMTQAVLEYEFLDENHVKYQRSTSISQLYDRTQDALAMLPDRIVFFTGLYDVDVFAADPQDFYNAYLERVNQVLAFDPDIQIYICSLLPPADFLGIDNLERSPEYDAQLQRLCNETAAHYVDTNWMVRQELYLEDGIHFDYDFYTIWIQYVAGTIGI